MNNYERITLAIVEAMSGDLPAWRKPWRTMRAAGASAVPVNAVSGRAYRGINPLLLWASGDADMRYLTYRQAQALGGNVKRGEHGTQVTFWKKSSYTEKTATGEDKERSSMLLKVYTVFNVSQCEGLNLKGAEAPEEGAQPLVMADIFAKCNAAVTHGGDRAAYAPGPDRIIMPQPAAFTSADAYTATALHELAHWTGHKARLDRELNNRFGDKAYAAEELVAELGAAFLCAHLGVDCALEHHASYLQHWRALLADDSRAIFTAASKAQAAADHVLNLIGQDESAEEVDLAEAA